jgi:hypothetical protein
MTAPFKPADPARFSDRPSPRSMQARDRALRLEAIRDFGFAVSPEVVKAIENCRKPPGEAEQREVTK